MIFFVYTLGKTVVRIGSWSPQWWRGVSEHIFPRKLLPRNKTKSVALTPKRVSTSLGPMLFSSWIERNGIWNARRMEKKRKSTTTKIFEPLVSIFIRSSESGSLLFFSVVNAIFYRSSLPRASNFFEWLLSIKIRVNYLRNGTLPQCGAFCGRKPISRNAS